MNMKFYVLSRLLSSTSWLLLSGYAAFLTTFFMLLESVLNLGTQLLFIVFALLLCLGHHFLSWRIKFDADLLDHLSQNVAQNGSNLAEVTQLLDQSLLYFKLIVAEKAGRDWKTRFEGCLKLFKYQIAILILQWTLFLMMCYIQFKS